MLFLKYVFVLSFLQPMSLVSCTSGTTLSFVLDNTGSMYPDIHYIKRHISHLIHSVWSDVRDIDDYVLVTFNDPDVQMRVQSKNIYEFLKAFNNVYPTNYFRDCGNLALTGIETALKASKNDSYMYVFTDASANDFNKVETIKNMCREKNIKVIFFLSGDCGEPENERFTVYHDIVEASFGQMFSLSKKYEIATVLKFLTRMIPGKKSVKIWKNLPSSDKEYAIPLKLEDKNSYAIVTAAGNNVTLRVSSNISKDYNHLHHIFRSLNGWAIQVFNFRPGVSYFAWVKGDSPKKFAVYTRDWYTIEPSSTQTPTRINENYLRMHVRDTDSEVLYDSNVTLHCEVHANPAPTIVWTNGSGVVLSRKVHRVLGDFYKNHLKLMNIQHTDTYICVANNSANSSRITIHISVKTADDDKNHSNERPIIKHAIGPINVLEANNLDLKCDIIQGYPKPHITWFKKNGHRYLPVKGITSNVYTISRASFADAGLYKCVAENIKGQDWAEFVVVVNKPPRVSIYESKGETLDQSPVELVCRTEAHPPPILSWQDNNGNIYPAKMSQNGHEFFSRIALENLPDEGNLSCIANNYYGTFIYPISLRKRRLNHNI